MHDLFGGPRPATSIEIAQAMETGDFDPGTVEVLVTEDEYEDAAGNTGWCAEVSNGHLREGCFVTLNFPSRAHLIDALVSAGIGHHQIEDI